MTIDQMIELLESYRDELGGDSEVRLMTQEAWPFENRICGLASSVEMADAVGDGEDDEADEPESDGDGEPVGDQEEPTVLYIVEGGQLCYGSKTAWDVCRS